VIPSRPFLCTSIFGTLTCFRPYLPGFRRIFLFEHFRGRRDGPSIGKDNRVEVFLPLVPDRSTSFSSSPQLRFSGHPSPFPSPYFLLNARVRPANLSFPPKRFFSRHPLNSAQFSSLVFFPYLSAQEVFRFSLFEEPSYQRPFFQYHTEVVEHIPSDHYPAMEMSSLFRFEVA